MRTIIRNGLMERDVGGTSSQVHGLQAGVAEFKTRQFVPGTLDYKDIIIIIYRELVWL